jgi:hypothetical protein
MTLVTNTARSGTSVVISFDVPVALSLPHAVRSENDRMASHTRVWLARARLTRRLLERASYKGSRAKEGWRCPDRRTKYAISGAIAPT